MPCFDTAFEAFDAFAKLTRWGNPPAPVQLAYLAGLRPKAPIEELVADANAIARELHPLCDEIVVTHHSDRIRLSLEQVALGYIFRVDCGTDARGVPRAFRVFEVDQDRS